MCLDAIEEILLRDRTFEKWHVLDVGTGTGILGIACAKLDADRVLCVDIDQKANGDRPENVLINQVEDRVEVAHRDVATLSESFELIVANLTAKILVKLSPVLLRLIVPGGYIVISGIIETEPTGHRGPVPRRFPRAPPPHHRKGVGLLCPEEGERQAVTIPRSTFLGRSQRVIPAPLPRTRRAILQSVLRMQEGDALSYSNGSDWEYEAVVRRSGDKAIALEILSKRPVPADEIRVTLCQAIPKAGKMDGIIRHATELGVQRIVPFLAERVDPTLADGQRAQKRERWQKIASEAARQCGRADVPEIGEIVPLPEC